MSGNRGTRNWSNSVDQGTTDFVLRARVKGVSQRVQDKSAQVKIMSEAKVGKLKF